MFLVFKLWFCEILGVNKTNPKEPVAEYWVLCQCPSPEGQSHLVTFLNLSLTKDQLIHWDQINPTTGWKWLNTGAKRQSVMTISIDSLEQHVHPGKPSCTWNDIRHHGLIDAFYQRDGRRLRQRVVRISPHRGRRRTSLLANHLIHSIQRDRRQQLT